MAALAPPRLDADGLSRASSSARLVVRAVLDEDGAAVGQELLELFLGGCEERAGTGNVPMSSKFNVFFTGLLSRRTDLSLDFSKRIPCVALLNIHKTNTDVPERALL